MKTRSTYQPNKEKYLTFPDNKNDISDDDLIVRYISHATVLISFSGINMLTDPVARASFF